jgi:serine phosphatase RsbU (regulator of sigma subunit)
MEVINNIGVVQQEMGDFKNALSSYIFHLKYSKILNETHTKTVAYFNIASVYDTLGNYDLALRYLDSSCAIAVNGNHFEDLIQVYGLYAKIHVKKNNFELAYAFLDKKAAVNDTLLLRNKNSLLIEMAEKYNSEKKDRENEVLRLKGEKHRLSAITLSVALALSAIIIFIVFLRYREKNSANKLLNQQNVSIAEQKKVIEEKHREITDSVHYAKKIQTVYLPPRSTFHHLFPSGYVFFQPKDVVSGDFYWFYKTEKSQGSGNYCFLAVADCTGHGIPGAIMSVICCNALNTVVTTEKTYDTGEILNKARDIVKKSLKSTNEEGQKDGMDIALIRIDRDTNEICYSGANNPLWIHDGIQMHEIAADKQPIGVHLSEKPFTVHCRNLKKGDRIYLFSDGFADQFGGPKGKKFKYKQFMELLASEVASEPSVQLSKLEKNFHSWRGDLEQVDDVTVVSVSIE